MSRKTAREDAFRILFSAQFQQVSPDSLISRYFDNKELPEIKDLEFIRQEVSGALKNQDDLYKRIEGALKDWKLSRLSQVDRAILQIAAYEMVYDEDIPVSVSINEAVELAKRYSSDAAPAFINGVLGTIAKELEA
ncbi:MAG: transcription antitermination factor NusB [Firmicutes bacterium]|nr:transcription antitermination factor NusB [Bacillota bacterium]